MCAMCGALLAFAIQTTMKYLSYSVTTTTTVVSEKPMEFPSVTICNANMYRKSVIWSQYRPMAYHVYDTSFQRMINVTLTNDTEAFQKYAAELDYEEFLKKTGHQLEGTVFSCMFDLQVMPCQDVFVRRATHSGYCYTFNPREMIQERGEPLYVNRAGKTYGLLLSLSVEQYEYFFGSWVNSACLEVRCIIE